jgi:hypothetical protein
MAEANDALVAEFQVSLTRPVCHNQYCGAESASTRNCLLFFGIPVIINTINSEQSQLKGEGHTILIDFTGVSDSKDI